MSSTFKTTPIIPLSNLTCILPILLMLDKLQGSYTDRFVWLPSWVLPRTILLHNPVVVWPSFFESQLSLSTLPPPFPTIASFTVPGHTSIPLWVHPQCQDLTVTSLTKEYFDAVWKIISVSPPTYSFYLYLHNLDISHPDCFFMAGFVLLNRHGIVVDSGWCLHHDQRASMFLALQAGLQYDLFGPCAIFLPQHDLTHCLFNQCKHAYLTFLSNITAALSAFLSQDPAHTVDFYHFKKSWKGLPGQARLDSLSSDTQNHPLLSPTPKPFT